MNNMITYTVADLDYIYIRVGSRDVTLKDLTDQEFLFWAKDHFSVDLVDSIERKNDPWTAKDRVDFINEMSNRLGHPAVVMIKRERRDEWDQATKNNPDKFTFEDPKDQSK